MLERQRLLQEKKHQREAQTMDNVEAKPTKTKEELAQLRKEMMKKKTTTSDTSLPEGA